MPLTDHQKLAILRTNPHAIAVYQNSREHGAEIIVHVTANHGLQPLILPVGVQKKRVQIRVKAPFKDLRLPEKFADQNCYNEPVPGGVQIKPRGAPWVGTLGCGCRFDSKSGHRRYGILSNWHVLCQTPTVAGTTIHQPTDARTPIARLEDWETVDPVGVNTFDAAVADAKIDELHTIGSYLAGIGHVDTDTVVPSVDLEVLKSGRTTGVTTARCLAIGAAVKVSYGDFTATFIDQAMFANPETPFSAPGDSGSLIVCKALRCPTALLFAGNNESTVGSPIQAIQNRFNLSFSFKD